MGKVRVGLIGTGSMANAMHYPSLASMDDVELAGLCEAVPEKREATADRFGIARRYSDYRRMIEEVKPEAVYVLMPPHHMFEVAMDVMGRGCHLFIEKPPGITAFQNRRLAERARKSGVIAMCGFQRRHVPLINRMRERVEAHGPVHTVLVHFVKHIHPEASIYNGVIDILSCDAIHAVDTLRHLCGGDVTAVASDVRNLGANDYNAYCAIAKFSSGATGILHANWACGRRFFKVEMHGLGVSAYAEPDEGGMLYADDDTGGEAFDPAACAGGSEDWRRLGFYHESRHFIDCVQAGREPVGSLDDTVKTMALVDAIYHSGMGGA